LRFALHIGWCGYMNISCTSGDLRKLLDRELPEAHPIFEFLDETDPGS